MLWLILSTACGWLIFRELWPHTRWAPIRESGPPPPVFLPYVIGLTVVGLVLGWQPFKYWRLERFLSVKATLLADGHAAHVHCNTVFDSFFDPNSLNAGHAHPESGLIVLQYPWCGRLLDYLAQPRGASPTELASLNIFTHESMHIRGEMNEAVTECQAVQRNRRAAVLLGVPAEIAKESARGYYTEVYLQRAFSGPFSAAYFSAECAAGKSLDEHLPDAFWSPSDQTSAVHQGR